MRTKPSATSYAFAAPGEGEGTWTYRVHATDGLVDGEPSLPLDEVKVDRTAPPAPCAVTDRPAEFDGGTPSDPGDDWWRDAVTVSFVDNGDPDLTDSSAGSGVDPGALPRPRTFSTTRLHHASGTVSDRAGNASPPAAISVRVNAIPPAVTIDCPAQVVLGHAASASWSATDAGSGLATASQRTVALDTSSVGRKSATAPGATDRVGLASAPAACN